MPFPWGELLGVFVFTTGLVGFVRWRWPARRNLCAALMMNGILLLFVGASAWLRQPEGQAVALLILGILPVYVLAVR